MKSLSELIREGDRAAVLADIGRDPGILEAAVEGAPSALLLALYFGQTEIAEAIRGFRTGLTLHEAAAMGDLHEIARNLALRPGTVNELSSDGFTALGYAAFFGHLEAVRALLDAGGDPALPSNNPMGVRPVHSAMSGGRKEMARLLLERGGGWSAASGEGWTPLHYAAHSGDVETARFLLENGADRAAVNREGKTPAAIAMDRGHTDLGSLLKSVQ
jgi:ankyrin repeat protein